jgi:hypothetical protein
VALAQLLQFFRQFSYEEPASSDFNVALLVERLTVILMASPADRHKPNGVHGHEPASSFVGNYHRRSCRPKTRMCRETSRRRRSSVSGLIDGHRLRVVAEDGDGHVVA